MATIYAGGSRRSANPTYTAFRPTTSAANNTLEDQLRAGIAANTPTTVAAPRLSEALGAGTLTTTGSGKGNVSFGGTPASPGLAGDARTLGGITSALGSFSQNADLGQVGGILGLAGALGEAKTPEQALGTLAGPALSIAGLPGGAVSLGKAALDGNASLAINSIIGLANPTIGVLNGLASLFGLPTLGDLASGKSSDSPEGYNVGGGAQGLGVVGRDMGNLTYGRDTEGQAGGFGGYGGGIGQSGGNAAGVGSAQA